MIDDVIHIVKKAAKEIMNIYLNEDFLIEIKDDYSPITKADKKANEIIIEELKKISSYPIITEESPTEYEIRKHWEIFWLVDPLDGTKDFLAKNGEFTINIALIKHNKPILGVVYIPMRDDTYYAIKDKGAYKNGHTIYHNFNRKHLIGSDSNFHSTKLMEDFFKKYNITTIHKYGAAIKLCKLAEGEIDVYPRLNGSKEWDTAAGHIIANEAGCKIIDIKTKEELLYNKMDIRNNFFIASKNELDFEI